jgi:hypothetical protein
MIPVALLSIIVAAALIIHCIKTGRNQIWIWVLIWLPGAGAVAYIVAELIPDLLRSRTAQRTVRGVKKALDPEATLRRLEGHAQLTGGVESNQRYADELVRQNRAGEAVEIYRGILKGLYEHDANLLFGLARAQFAQGQAAAARGTLDDLIRHNPEFKSPEGHLLYARALEGEGQTDRALEEYKALAAYYPGAEAPVRYAQLLLRAGRKEDARTTLRELLDRAKVAPAHYRRTQEEWLRKAERESGS